MSEFSDSVVEYMSGYVVKRICEKLSCEDCKHVLTGNQKHGLIFTREFNSEQEKLVYPSKFVHRVLCVAESVLKSELEKNWLGKKYFFDYVNIKIVNSFISLHSVMMKAMDNHCYDLLKEQHYKFLLFSLSLSLSHKHTIYMVYFTLYTSQAFNIQ